MQPKTKKSNEGSDEDEYCGDDEDDNGSGDVETMVAKPSAGPSPRCLDSDQKRATSVESKAKMKEILYNRASGSDGNRDGGGETMVLQPSADPSPCRRNLADPVESTGETNCLDEPDSSDETGCSTKVLQQLELVETASAVETVSFHQPKPAETASVVETVCAESIHRKMRKSKRLQKLRKVRIVQTGLAETARLAVETDVAKGRGGR